MNQAAERPSWYTIPTVPIMAQPLSELAVDEMAVTHAPILRPPRKKSSSVFVRVEAKSPMQNRTTMYATNTSVMISKWPMTGALRSMKDRTNAHALFHETAIPVKKSRRN